MAQKLVQVCVCNQRRYTNNRRNLSDRQCYIRKQLSRKAVRLLTFSTKVDYQNLVKIDLSIKPLDTQVIEHILLK